jgi:hypothetical protein
MKEADFTYIVIVDQAHKPSQVQVLKKIQPNPSSLISFKSEAK